MISPPLNISHRSVLADTKFVCLVRGCDADGVSAMVDRGDLQWVFDVTAGDAQPGRRRIRELRFWVSEVLAPDLAARFGLEEVLDGIVPPSRKFYRGTEAAMLLLVSRPTACRIAREIGGSIKDRAYRISREALAAFLRRRWIGAGIPTGNAPHISPVNAPGRFPASNTPAPGLGLNLRRFKRHLRPFLCQDEPQAGQLLNRHE